MGSSSINLNSLLSSLGSSTSGFDVQSAVAQEIAAESIPMNQWQQQQSALQLQTSDINILEGHISTLQTALNALGDPAGALTSMSATSSNTNLVTASATAGTVGGNHVVVVNNLATTGSWYSSSQPSSSTALGAGSFNIQVGSGSAIPITLGSGVNTLDQLVTYINGLGAGVTASVVNDSTGSRLALVSSASGSASDINVTGATGLTFTQATKGKDASLTVDGIPIDSATNTVTGAVNGLTLNLTGAAPGTEVNVGVTPDATQVSQAINNFVSAYNTVIGDVNTEYTVSANHQEGPLGGDATLRQLQSQLLAAGSYTNGGGAITTLGGLGISMNSDGTLAVDSAALSNAIQNNFSGVQNFLQGTASNGFAASLNTQMSALIDPVSGAFTVDLQSISAENADLTNQISEFQTYIATRQAYLTNEYNQADIALKQLPQLQAQINAELGYAPTTTTS
jgi:flagellar hook-associated protein 2